MNLDGTHVAMITPFDGDNNIDEEKYRNFIDFLIDQGVDGIVAAGTTGESATMTHDEHQKVIDIMVDQADGRVTTIAGAGSNATAEALDLLKYVEDAGADAALVITPYYNKPQQSGLYNHYKLLNDSTNIPIIAYNVPSRTGVDLSIDTILKIAELDNIVAIKEANPDLNKLAEVFSRLAKSDIDDFTVLSGNDSLTLPMISQGARGVISVVANVLPNKMSTMVRSALDADYTKARTLSNELYDMMDVLFIEASPAPTKRALNYMGMDIGGLRMPINEISQENDAILKDVLKEYNLL
ncbi:MAG: 4-hydroxy-tetrahydrodipicolinate synthase [Methanosphaera sp.]|uniref:4-hydroxy-tetrahydrodipicolinate synthase n=1 Tax=Methanosphaera sp. TaxID=2666342 RepID=UPI0025EF2590|nr:4-hydroxy-tetrahydrodipicolinate synthase [Methanosphaera sp.]MCI5867651.1 4-hydroxy-tetrahydrodipicolinate synthase [Methanosphaera sp.]MDD6534119.1 4-hydroxy-tetrahydrodipicolinate synthase [Methanosphaera sp.]MDY3956072.1 4-hydroxy-tetrahydrodipicolinate synthase [Methanosphaera sp.]